MTPVHSEIKQFNHGQVNLLSVSNKEATNYYVLQERKKEKQSSSYISIHVLEFKEKSLTITESSMALPYRYLCFCIARYNSSSTGMEYRPHCSQILSLLSLSLL